MRHGVSVPRDRQAGHGAGLDPRQVALVGARDIDPAERELLDQAGVRIFPPSRSDPRALAEFEAGGTEVPEAVSIEMFQHLQRR